MIANSDDRTRRKRKGWALFEAEVAYAVGIFRSAIGDSERCIRALERAVEIGPGYAPAVLALGSVEYQRKRKALPVWAGVLSVLPLKAIEWQFLILARRLCSCGLAGFIVSLALAATWCLAVSLSVLAAQSTIYDMLAAADRAGAKEAETRTNLRSAFDEVRAQIASFPKPLPRPVKVLEQAAWIALPTSVRHATDDCKRFANDAQRGACKELGRVVS